MLPIVRMTYDDVRVEFRHAIGLKKSRHLPCLKFLARQVLIREAQDLVFYIPSKLLMVHTPSYSTPKKNRYSHERRSGAS